MTRRQGEKCVLVCRFSALGDVAMTLPPLYDACRQNPDCQFIFLTKPHPAELFINPPENLEIYAPDPEFYKGIGGLYRLFRKLRARGVNTVVDLHDVIRTKIIRFFFMLSGVKIAHLNKQRKSRRALTSGKIKKLTQLPAIETLYSEVFRKAGISVEPIFKSLFPIRLEKSELKKYLPEAFCKTALSPESVITAIAPFARHRGKIYPSDLMERLIDLLAVEPDRCLLIFGFGKTEEELIEKWRKGRDNIVNMAALRLGMQLELRIMNCCDNMLSMDSANMHLAGLVDLPVISVWGATHPYTGFAGRTAPLKNAVQLEMTCRPCSVYGNKPCARGDYHCLRGISPELIADHLRLKSHDS